jgi:hypothetical protein
MKSTFHQIPNMKGKRHYNFGCKCCTAQNFKEHYNEKFDRRQLEFDISDYNRDRDFWRSIITRTED